MPDRRFDGAITTPDPAINVSERPLADPAWSVRPAAIELAAAILIIGGLTSLIGSLATIGRLGAPSGALDLLLLGLAGLTIVVGVLVRNGRAWILDLNVVAILVFLELTALPSMWAILFAGLDGIVLWALIRYRSWFERRARGGS